MFFHLGHVSLFPHLAAYLYLFLCISRAAMSPGISRMALCCRCPVGPSDTVSLVCVPCINSVYSAIIVEPYLLFACKQDGLTLGLRYCEDWL